MIVRLMVFTLGVLLMTACAGRSDRRVQEQRTLGSGLNDPAEHAFFNRLGALCGQSFRGEQQFMAEGRESWAHKAFVMHVSVCEDDRVYIPFHLDEDHSRTWMFLVEDGRLRFRHDHRHPDGSPEEITLYGGYANGLGTAYRQDFPADEYTCELLPTACFAVWRVELSDEDHTFSYSLFSRGELLFTAVFDLADPL